MRVLVIGIDAACTQVLKPLFDDDRLPTLRGLGEEGVASSLTSYVPPWTPSMWPSLYTGVNPGKHGVFSFLSYDGYSHDLVNASHVREYAVWELLSTNSRSSVIVNVPVTHPPSSFDGALIPGYMAPENPPCYPADVLTEVRDEIGDYRVYPPIETDSVSALEHYTDLIEMRGAAFRYLTQKYDPDFGFVQFQQTDTVFHEHPGNLDLAGSIYEAVDREIEQILEVVDPATLFIVSDHGIGEYTGYGFRVNTFLKEKGYVKSTISGTGMPSWVPIRDRNLRAGVDSVQPATQAITQRVLEIAAKIGVTTNRIGSLLETAGLRGTVARFVPDSVVRSGQPHVDFANSVAYMRARIELGIRINLEGREPNGIVAQDEYDAVRSELIHLLEGVETPDGDQLFEEVAPREEYFTGPETEHAVDIVTIPREYDHFLTATIFDQPFGPPGQPWNHKLEGILIAAGDDIDSTGSLAVAHIFDIAPSILAAFGLPSSDRMDGDVLDILEAHGTRAYPRYRSTRRPLDTEAAIEDRLRTLGYLET